MSVVTDKVEKGRKASAASSGETASDDAAPEAMALARQNSALSEDGGSSGPLPESQAPGAASSGGSAQA
jgi:hypothetical protein